MEKTVQLRVILVNRNEKRLFVTNHSFLACYGIVTIPDGDWYCGRCEAGDIRAVCKEEFH